MIESKTLKSKMLRRLSAISVIATVFFWCSPTLTFAIPCDVTVASLEKIQAGINSVVDRLRSLNPDLVSGKKTPTREDFEHLEGVAKDLMAVKAGLQSSNRLAEVLGMIDELAPTIKSGSVAEALKASDRTQYPRDYRYQPEEYDLKTLYQRLLREVNREIPPSLQFPIVRFPKDTRSPELIRLAEIIVKQQAERLAALYSTSGFKNREELETAIRNHSPQARALLQFFHSDKMEITIRRPEGGRWWIPKVGFQNQYVTGSSRGAFNTKWRTRVEADYLGILPAEYERLDHELKLKYGAFRPSPDSGIVDDQEDDQYGDDIWVLKPDRVKNRIVISLGDSLDRFDPRTNKPGIYQPTAWDQVFIPYEDRALVIPTFLYPFQTGKFAHDYNARRALEGSLAPYNRSWKIGSKSSELGILGPLLIDDAYIFEFRRHPPVGKFLHDLQERNFIIRDGRDRSRPARVWTPPGN